MRREKCARMGRENAHMIKSYTWDRFARGLLATYREALADSQAAPAAG